MPRVVQIQAYLLLNLDKGMPMRYMIIVKATDESEAETKELIAGYTLIQVKSREEATCDSV